MAFEIKQSLQEKEHQVKANPHIQQYRSCLLTIVCKYFQLLENTQKKEKDADYYFRNTWNVLPCVHT